MAWGDRMRPARLHRRRHRGGRLKSAIREHLLAPTPKTRAPHRASRQPRDAIRQDVDASGGPRGTPPHALRAGFVRAGRTDVGATPISFRRGALSSDTRAIERTSANSPSGRPRPGCPLALPDRVIPRLGDGLDDPGAAPSTNRTEDEPVPDPGLARVGVHRRMRRTQDEADNRIRRQRRGDGALTGSGRILCPPSRGRLGPRGLAANRVRPPRPVRPMCDRREPAL